MLYIYADGHVDLTAGAASCRAPPARVSHCLARSLPGRCCEGELRLPLREQGGVIVGVIVAQAAALVVVVRAHTVGRCVSGPVGCATRLASGHGLLVYLLVCLPASRLAGDAAVGNKHARARLEDVPWDFVPLGAAGRADAAQSGLVVPASVGEARLRTRRRLLLLRAGHVGAGSEFKDTDRLCRARQIK